MCVGTLCTHHINPVVQELEQPYDDWEFYQTPIYTGTNPGDYMPPEPDAYVINVRGRTISGGGPSHDQPMIRLKDDVGRWYDATDADVRRYLYCNDCANGGHKCYGCKREITHMAHGKCPECVDEYENEFMRSIRESL